MNKNASKKLTTIRIDEELYKKVEELSKKSERTVSRQINYMLKEWIKIKEQ